MEFAYDGGGFGNGGTAKLSVNGREVASGRVDKTEMHAAAEQARH